MSQGFPEGFSWGTATAAHQIEGGNTNNDWWRFEHTPGTMASTSSGDATDSYHRWEQDADIIAALGFDNYRFSIEWSRIEPADGEFSQAALDHYARVCEGLRERGIDPVVTFHHFTTPIWMADKGGWQNPEIADRFATYVEKAATRLNGLMTKACTINEPNIYATHAYYFGLWPPGERSLQTLTHVYTNLAAAHIDAVAGHGDLGGETAMDRIVAQQMRVGFDRTKIVDCHDLNVVASRFDDRAQNVSTDPAKSVDRHLDSHGVPPPLMMKSACR